MVKPKGTTGATKMKIMALISFNQTVGRESYGYTIWQSLKELFYIYLNDCDVRNVYHHLKELCDLDLIEKVDLPASDVDNRCFYTITDKGLDMKIKYDPYLLIVQRAPGVRSKY
ncbi:MAG: helix-turn-helix transcriptional regulator [Candidatus Bathyarchaeota archaeon]|nr:MAG: helix-turn-helix transcriptional regulator [Candidatus Bathyarchaeota archaeon]